MGWIEPVTLAGRMVTLVPLRAEHRDALVEAASDGELWRLWYTSVPDPDGMAAAIADRLRQQEAGSMLPFAVTETATGRPVGMTSFGHIDAANRRVEIGWTWYARRLQRTGANT
ncbi:MAG: GNAT family N-acetyltransferase, partial [Gluconacetobacter diazotrophicus]|nr:GNAT family N-acetyltransferase [Gluconacetobacter diazotrophicus]